MLDSCRSRATKLNLSTTLYETEIEHFSPTKTYQGIIIPFGCFQLLHPKEDALAALERFNQWLAPQGKLVMDLSRADEMTEGTVCNQSTATLSESESIVLTSWIQLNQNR